MALDRTENSQHHGDRGCRMDGMDTGCFGKTAYARLELAERNMRRILRSKGNRNKSCPEERLNPYRCRACGHWHIGNGVVRSGQRKGELKPFRSARGLGSRRDCRSEEAEGRWDFNRYRGGYGHSGLAAASEQGRGEEFD